MSTALLQSDFQMNRRRGIRLEFILHEDGVCYKTPLEPLVTCTLCAKQHPQLWVAWRKPAGTWGHWVVFRYLGAEHVPDLSVPISVPQPPHGARKLAAAENSQAWHN